MQIIPCLTHTHTHTHNYTRLGLVQGFTFICIRAERVCECVCGGLYTTTRIRQMK